MNINSLIKEKDGKECTKCKEFKLYNEFSISITRKDGYQDWCSTCHKIYSKTEKGKESGRTRYKRWRIRNPLKKKAHNIIGALVNRNKLIKPEECSICGKINCKIEAHHHDYSKPFKITWCCYRCHKDIHRGKI